MFGPQRYYIRLALVLEPAAVTGSSTHCSFLSCIPSCKFTKQTVREFRHFFNKRIRFGNHALVDILTRFSINGLNITVITFEPVNFGRCRKLERSILVCSEYN